MKLSLKEYRFLIIWITIHSIALLVNVADIRCNVKRETAIFKAPFGFHDTRDYDIDLYSINLLTSGHNAYSFYPFVEFEESGFDTITENDKNIKVPTYHFYGILNDYGYREFFVYIFLALLIIYLPKIWSLKKG